MSTKEMSDHRTIKQVIGFKRRTHHASIEICDAEQLFLTSKVTPSSDDYRSLLDLPPRKTHRQTNCKQ